MFFRRKVCSNKKYLSDSLPKTQGHFRPPNREMPPAGGRTAFCALKRGSFTLEAALAAPLFFFCLITLICFMELYGVSVRQSVNLQQKAETAGEAAGLADVSSDGWIDLYIPAVWSLKGIPGGKAAIPVAARARVHSWTGRDESENDGSGSGMEDMVYVTDNRSVYHVSPECTHLDLSVHKVSASEAGRMRNTDGARYHACERCVGSGQTAGSVYITDDGDRYHNSRDCGGLTRTVYLVERSSVGSLPVCSRCGARHG